MYVLGPLIVAALLGALILVARWALGNGKSLVDGGSEYGLLKPIAEGGSIDDLSPIQDVLLGAGVRNTMAEAPGGYRLLVWPADLARARDLIRQIRGLS
jgi:hypothetical protein